MKRRMAAFILVCCIAMGMAGCGSKESQEKREQEDAGSRKEAVQEPEAQKEEPEEIQVFIAASLNTVMTELAEKYHEVHPEVKIVYNADSSGKLLTQIEEGYACDIFFSAAQKQMDQLEQDGFVLEGTRHNVVNNQVVLLTLKDSETKVTGLENLQEA